MTDAFLDQYRSRFTHTWSDGDAIDNVRFVALDSETTGLNPLTDRIITIGAVAVQGGDIVLDDAFEALLRVERNTAAVAVHGITRDVRLKAVVQGTDTDPWGNERVGLEVVGTLKRSDFDMKFNQALGSGNVLVGDKVNMSLDISAVKQT